MNAEIAQYHKQDNYHASLDKVDPFSMDNKLNLLHEDIHIRGDQITSA